MAETFQPGTPLFAEQVRCALTYKAGPIVTLIVNALREKAEGDRKAAESISASADGTDHDLVMMSTLHQQAELGEAIADELEAGS